MLDAGVTAGECHDQCRLRDTMAVVTRAAMAMTRVRLDHACALDRKHERLDHAAHEHDELGAGRSGNADNAGILVVLLSISR